MMQDKISETLEKWLDHLKTGEDFVIEQAPEVIEQILLWNGVKSFILFLIMSTMSLICIIVIAKSSKMITEENDDDGVFGIIGGMLCFSLFMYLAFINLEWLQIWIAPKAYLIEYISGMIK